MSDSDHFLIKTRNVQHRQTGAANRMSASESRQTTINDILENLPISFFHTKLLIICGLSFMADSMEVSLLSFLSACAGDEFNLSNSARASLVGIVFVGELIGSLFWGPLADHYGRKVAFLLACCLVSLFGFLSAFSPNYVWLFASRAIVGFGVGGGSVPFDLLAEFLPGNYRGTYLISIQYAWTIGTLFVVGLAWLSLSTGGWRQLTMLTAVPVTVACVACIFYLPESPRWLMAKGHFAEAERVVRVAAADCRVNLDNITLLVSSTPLPPSSTIIILSIPSVAEASILPTLAPSSSITTNATADIATTTSFQHASPANPAAASSPSNSCSSSGQNHITTYNTTVSGGGSDNDSSSWYDLIATPRAFRITLLLWIIWFIFGFTYYGLVLFVNRLFTSSSSSSSSGHSVTRNYGNNSNIKLNSVVHHHGQLPSHQLHLSSAVVSKDHCDFDYSPIFMNSLSEFIGVFICALVIDIWGRVSTQAAFFGAGGVALVLMGLDSLSFTTLLIASIIGRLCLMGASSATWLVTPELYPTPLRATGHSYCVCLSRLGGFLSPFLVISKADNQTIGAVLGSLSMVALIASLLLPETVGVSLDAEVSNNPFVHHSDSGGCSTPNSPRCGQSHPLEPQLPGSDVVDIEKNRRSAMINGGGGSINYSNNNNNNSRNSNSNNSSSRSNSRSRNNNNNNNYCNSDQVNDEVDLQSPLLM